MGSKQLLPQARTDQLVVQTLPDETLVYDLTRHKAHCLNQAAASVWEHCDGQTTVADMAARLGQNLNAPVNEDVVWLALEQLGKVHLLQAQTPKAVAGPRMSRRTMVRQLGLGAAIAIPAIVSIIAPEAAQAVSVVCGGLNQKCCRVNNNDVCNAGLQCNNGKCVTQN